MYGKHERRIGITNKEYVNLHDAVKNYFPKILEKDLMENERICPYCHGTGMRIENNIYGIKGDKSELAKRYRFPYKHQALSFCQSCFNGVQSSCPYCGRPYKNQAYTHCDCEGQKKADEEEKIKRWNEKVTKAVAIDEKDVSTKLYCEELDKYYSDIEEFFDDYYCHEEYEDEETYTRPKVLWVTSEEKIHIDADDIVENACEDLWEDAYDQCDIASLQVLLDKWCKEQIGTTTYYPRFDQYVKIDWTKYK